MELQLLAVLKLMAGKEVNALDCQVLPNFTFGPIVTAGKVVNPVPSHTYSKLVDLLISINGNCVNAEFPFQAFLNVVTFELFIFGKYLVLAA
jgi:hypothetical protein